MFKKYDKVICLEDDTIIKKNLMSYMRKKLISYQYNKKIMSITGYAFPIKLPKNYEYDIFFLKDLMPGVKHHGKEFGNFLKK